ncbi:10903_t:CDS:2, partial [Funneliformis mosseae]
MFNENESHDYDRYSTRIFNQDYPNSSHIVATYKSGDITFISWYNVISLEQYPINVMMTQKNSKNGKQYWIPNDYVVETEFGYKKLYCEIKYISNQKIRYNIFWKENNTEWSVYSERSTTGAVTAFLKLAAFDKDSERELSSLIKKHYMTTVIDQPIIYIRNIELDFNGETINLTNQHNIEPKKLDAIVRACDESLLSRDGYRRLSAVKCHLIQILIDEVEIGNGVYRSIQTLLRVLISIWKNTSPPILKQKDTINLKISGDGRNVRRKQKH